MIRSNFAITRLLIFPYLGLLTLYLLIVGGGGYWILHTVEQVEARLTFDEIASRLEPVVGNIKDTDSVALFRQEVPWIIKSIEALFRDLPSLSSVSTQNDREGYRIQRLKHGVATPVAIGGIKKVAHNYNMKTAQSRLYDDKEGDLLVRYNHGDVTLEFTFDRQQLLDKINGELSWLHNTVWLFLEIGAASILLAFLITLYAVVKTREVESYFQALYQQASISDLLTSLAHDLRNPLAALRANIRALRLTPDQLEDIADDLDEDVMRLDRRLALFLDLNRHTDVPFKLLNIRSFLEDVARLARPILEQAGLSLKLELPTQLPALKIHEPSLRDALLNLIQNAAQSNQRNGEVSLRAVQPDRNTLCVIVEDRGQGVSKDQLAKIFTPYYSTKDNGNGLGLAIARRVLLDHHGDIAITNRAGGGLRVILTLPMKRKETPGWFHALKKPHH